MSNAQGHKAIVLIVDDFPTNVEILATALRGEYRIRVAADGEDALKAATMDPRPDVILLDVMMPGMDGFEVCRRLKADARTRNIPVIFVTAMNEEQDEELGLRLGAIDYITKPYSLPIIKARIRNHVRMKQQADLLEELSMIDPLTHLPNRRRFNEVLDTEWKRAMRQGGSLSVLMIDVDHFKEYNDQHGHSAGDRCLQAVAGALAASLSRPADQVARYGGEEFVVTLPETDLAGASTMAERLRQAVADLELVHDHSEPVSRITVSIGVANSRPSSLLNDQNALMEAADARLYEAKGKGRNQVVC